MAKMTLTEEKLRTLVENTVRKALNELDWRTTRSAANKAKKDIFNTNLGFADKAKRSDQYSEFSKDADERQLRQYGFTDERYVQLYHMENDLSSEELARMDSIKNWCEKHNVPVPSRSELRRYQQMNDDVKDYYSGRTQFQDGKWQNMQ